jgi:predicted deacylase
MIQSFFPKDYREGRHNFIAACEPAGAEIVTRVHPTATGPDGKALFIDCALTGSRHARKALLLIAGTHGVEGTFGSGALTGLLRNGLPARLDTDTRLVMIHALNPYGFAWDRRVTEDNIDLNRNFIDHANPPENPAYAALADAIAPSDISDAALREADAKLEAFVAKHGERALQDAMTPGQYRFPKGLFFGGTALTWSARMLKDILDEHLPDAETLIAIDFHTGLGEFGEAELIVEDLPGTPAFERAMRMWGAVVSTETGESLSSPLNGTLDQAFAAWRGHTKLNFAVLEMGTTSWPQTIAALRKDNWLYGYADGKSPDAADIRRQLRSAFAPDDATWRKKAFVAAETTVASAVKALG